MLYQWAEFYFLCIIVLLLLFLSVFHCIMQQTADRNWYMWIGTPYSKWKEIFTVTHVHVCSSESINKIDFLSPKLSVKLPCLVINYFERSRLGCCLIGDEYFIMNWWAYKSHISVDYKWCSPCFKHTVLFLQTIL